MVTPPGAGTKVALTTSSVTAQNLTSYQGKWIVIYLTAAAHVRFGTSSVDAATTDDVIFPAGQHIPFYIPPSGARSYFRARTVTGTGDLHYADASDA